MEAFKEVLVMLLVGAAGVIAFYLISVGLLSFIKSMFTSFSKPAYRPIQSSSYYEPNRSFMSYSVEELAEKKFDVQMAYQAKMLLFCIKMIVIVAFFSVIYHAIIG